MNWWDPTTWGEASLKSLLTHVVVPIILWIMALGVLLFAPLRLRWKIIIAVLLAVAGAILWGIIQIPGWS